jgi:predicted GNAT family acetyltransferase
MNIQHEETGRKGMFFIEENGERVAEIDYLNSAKGKINIYHTEVTDRLRSQGVGRALVKAVMDHARDTGLKVIPTCPFAKRVVDETPEYEDLVTDA